jgi:hypothetical protein
MDSDRAWFLALTIASGSGPDRSPVSSVPADMGDRGFEWRLEEGRFNLKPDGAGRSSFENWVAIPPGVIVPDALGLLRPSGVTGGFDMVICNRYKG